VKNAATRKYLTRDWLWYWPPGPMMERLATYANDHGAESGWPYFSLDGKTPVTAKAWDSLRYRWNHAHGLTNVWSRPPLHDGERLKGTMRRAAPRVYKPTGTSAAHLNQKPLEFMERLIYAVTDPGEVVWEPFGGLASASVAAVALGRRPFAAELDDQFARLATERLQLAVRERDVAAEGDTVTTKSKPLSRTSRGARAPRTGSQPGRFEVCRMTSDAISSTRTVPIRALSTPPQSKTSVSPMPRPTVKMR
jgi:site-specific DNA-methyltransferase (adenine-specific)